MQLYRAASENQFVDTGTAARLQGGVSSLCWAPRQAYIQSGGPDPATVAQMLDLLAEMQTGVEPNGKSTGERIRVGSCILHPFIAISAQLCSM